jgi:subtilisin family serine protease
VVGIGNITDLGGTGHLRTWCAMSRLVRCFLLILLAVCIPVSAVSARELLASGGKTQLAKSSGVTTLRSTAQKAGKVKVIVGLRVPFSPEGRMRSDTVRVQRRDIATAVSSVRARFQKVVQRNPKGFRSYDSVPFVAMEVTPEELDSLAADPNVISISENRVLKPLLAQSIPLVEADKAWAASYSGLGQTIAIIDTGVDRNHPFLAGKVVSEACYSIFGQCPGGVTASTAAGSGMPCSHSSCSHGTHVAGIAAGLGSNFSGVARNANVIAIQVFSTAYGSLGAYDSDLLAALERVYALRNDFKIAAVNLSLGGGAYSSFCDGEVPAFTAAVNNLASVGIATIAASGNSYYTSRISYPACISSVVSVGSVLDAAAGLCSAQPSADKVACYSNSASFLSLLAPGSLIQSSTPNNQYSNMEGTSMATPHVAGAWAVLKQKAPNAPVSQVLAALQNTGKPITDYRNGIVKKRINVKAALDSLPAGDDRLDLQFTRAGSGSGAVSFTPAGTLASCTESCSNSYPRGAVVTMAAVAAQGSTFKEWSGACSGAGACTVTMSQAHSVSASFVLAAEPAGEQTLVLQYGKLGPGSGTVSFTPAGTLASCANSCSNSFAPGATVTLTASADAGSAFLEWSGACSGTGVCTVAMSQAASVNANFIAASDMILTYNKAGSGAGSVSFTSTAGTKSCAASCVTNFGANTLVTLRAEASYGSVFGGWTGACRGRSKSCRVRIKDAASVTAAFNLLPVYAMTVTVAGGGSGNVALSAPDGVKTCDANCSNNYPSGTRVRLTATAAPGMVFAGWDGACRTKRTTCTVTLRAARTVSASFSAP